VARGFRRVTFVMRMLSIAQTRQFKSANQFRISLQSADHIVSSFAASIVSAPRLVSF
jgi:hypothetical protein